MQQKKQSGISQLYISHVTSYSTSICQLISKCPFGVFKSGAEAVCSMGFQNQRMHILLEASKSAGAKGGVPNLH